MSSLQQIHGKPFVTSDFSTQIIPEYYPMKPRTNVSRFDRDVAFLKELLTISNKIYFDIRTSTDGYIIVNCDFDQIYIQSPWTSNLETNIKSNCVKGTVIPSLRIPNEDCIIFTEEFNLPLINPIIITLFPILKYGPNYTQYFFNMRYVYVHSNFLEKFKTIFIVKNNHILYDNLINILIMVKNAGDGFKTMLLSNIKFADEITILDTGSTDNTLNIINDVFSSCSIKHTLYKKPWKNFRDSRNELFELAGNRCAFNIMLDDTYVISDDDNQLRNFLTIARSDDEADSYSIFIKDDFTTYSSNRITKPDRKLKYQYLIHEIVESNKNFEIPSTIACVIDVHSEYMKDRTNNRKLEDLKLLFDELAIEPNNPRNFYYIAETYLCLKDWENSLIYYEKRSNMGGFSEEVQDSLYKIAVINHFNMDKPWDICLQLFLNCHNYDPTRSESTYVIGYYYNTINDLENAYKYLIQSYEISKQYRPTTMNSKYKINRYDLPKLLLQLCLQFEDYKNGFECAQKCIEYENKQVEKSENNLPQWLSIFHLMVEYGKNKKNVKTNFREGKKLTCFVLPGGWSQFDGETLITKGLGGSEACVIKYAEYLATAKDYVTVIACNCEKYKVFNDVHYVNIFNFPTFISKYFIDVIFINRYPEYVPICVYNVKKVYLMLHDLVRHQEIIPYTNKLEKIITLSEWHKKQVVSYFPYLEAKIDVMSYGIDVDEYHTEYKDKIPFSFIYPSFPNRGLLQLLKLFPKIKLKYPQATLNVFCDLDQAWVNEYHGKQIIEIKKLIGQSGVVNHGWVSQEMLKRFWKISHIWLYPCVFEETYCRCILEAAASKTLIVTTGIGALQENVGTGSLGRGIIIDGNPNTDEWQNKAVDMISYDNFGLHTTYTERNYNWVCAKNYPIVVQNFFGKYIN